VNFSWNVDIGVIFTALMPVIAIIVTHYFNKFDRREVAAEQTKEIVKEVTK
jgi:hypothetical protein